MPSRPEQSATHRSRHVGRAFGAVLLANSLATQISGIVGLSGFLSDVGVSQLLIVWLIDDLSILAMAAGQAFLVDRFNRLALVRWVTVTFGLSLLCVRLLPLLGLPGWLTYALLYAVSEQQFLFFPLVFWVLVEDSLSYGDRQRLFPLIGSYGLVGKLLGIALSAVAPLALHFAGIDPLDVLYLDAAMYAAAWAVLRGPLRHLRIRGRSGARETAARVLTEGFAFVQGVPAFRYLAFSSLATLAAGLVVEFHFYNVTHGVFGDLGLYETFFSVYRFGFVLLSVLVETLAAGRILAKLGLKNVFLALPAMALAGSIAVAVAPGFLPVALLGLVIIRLPQNTIDELARKQFQGLVPEERRGRVSLLMDGYLFAGGDLLGCLACGIGVLLATVLSNPRFDGASLALGLLLSCGAVAATVAMRRSWDVSLLNWRLHRRRRGSELLDRLADDPGAASTI